MGSRIILLLVLILPAVASGEPTETPKYLMSEPMSLMDWGIYQADKKMESFRVLNHLKPDFFSIHYMGGSARYDWNENRIVLSGMFEGNGTQDECTENLRKLKSAFADPAWDAELQREAAEVVVGVLLDDANPELQRKAAERVLDVLFSHEAGYQTKGRPTDVGKQLIHITIIEAHIPIRQIDAPMLEFVTCKSTFKSSEVSIIAK